MAGLFDFLESDDAALGLGLLAAGGPSTVPMGFGQRLASGIDYARQRKDSADDRRFKRSLMQSQIDENMSQAEARKAATLKAQQQAEFDRLFLYGDGAAGGGGSTAPASNTAGTPLASGGGGAPFGGMTARQISERYGIPLDQVIADWRFNSGKKLSEFIDSRTKPDWTVVNGYRFNKNDPGSTTGFVPGISTSANGQITVTGVDPRTGQPYAYAAPGSIDAAGAFVEAQERAKAPYTPGKGRIGANGRPEPTSVAEDLGIARAPAPVLPGRPLGAPAPGRQFNSPGLAGGSTANAASGQIEILSAELGKAGQELQRAQQSGDPAAVQRAQSDLAGLARELRRLPGGTQVLAQLTQGGQAGAAPAAPAVTPAALPGRPLGAPAAAPAPDATGIGVAGGTDFSPREKTAQELERVRSVEQIKADIVPKAEKQKALNAGNDALRTIDKALTHPGLKEATGLQGTLDPRNYVPGTDAWNFAQVRNQLKGQTFLQAYNSLKGGGAITEVEGTKAENAIARLDKAQSTEEFTAALKDLRDVVDRGLKLTRGEQVPDAPLPNNPGGKGKKQVFESLPNPSQFKGRSVRDTVTGKTMISDGITWKAAD